MFTLTINTDNGKQAQRVFFQGVAEVDALLDKTLTNLKVFKRLVSISNADIAFLTNFKSLISQAK